MTEEADQLPNRVVLDASAVLAFVQGEEGADLVEATLTDGAVCGAANWSEVAQKVLAAARDWDLVKALLVSYEVDIEPVSGTVTVGPCEALAVDHVSGTRPRWCGAPPDGALEGTVQLRAHGAEHRAVVRVAGDEVSIELLDPAEGIAPGQSAVYYDGTRVVGSCTITRTARTARR